MLVRIILTFLLKYSGIQFQFYNVICTMYNLIQFLTTVMNSNIVIKHFVLLSLFSTQRQTVNSKKYPLSMSNQGIDK